VSQSDPGIGPHSCWAGVSYTIDGISKIQTGFSQMKNEIDFSTYTKPLYKKPYVKYHGEVACLAHALDDIMNKGWSAGVSFPIGDVYIEMSPCPKCMTTLENILPDRTLVMYSFLYSTEIDIWKREASRLCGQ
jgi:hypothetical protein